jgi:hypothetical protein
MQKEKLSREGKHVHRLFAGLAAEKDGGKIAKKRPKSPQKRQEIVTSKASSQKFSGLRAENGG